MTTNEYESVPKLDCREGAEIREYTKNTGLHTVHGWTVWYVNDISVKLLKRPKKENLSYASLYYKVCQKVPM